VRIWRDIYAKLAGRSIYPKCHWYQLCET